MSPRIDPNDLRRFDNVIFSARNRSPASLSKDYTLELPDITAGVRMRNETLNESKVSQTKKSVAGIRKESFFATN